MDKDIREKNCLLDNERYADLINGLLWLFGTNTHDVVWCSVLRKTSTDHQAQSDPAYQDMDEEAYDMVVAYTGVEELKEDIDILHRTSDVAEKVIPKYDVGKICEIIL